MSSSLGCTNVTGIPGIPETTTTTLSTSTTTTTVTTTAPPTTAGATTNGCCPEYANTDPIICPILCQLIYGRRLLVRAADEDPNIDTVKSEPDDEIVEMMTNVYIFLETRLKCFPEGNIEINTKFLKSKINIFLEKIDCHKNKYTYI